ncbi:MAG: hypothetical protein DDT23_01315 [candidate division WS2 bacterium]|nr:hypothetical protein [Candidatus Lithacetigena glycinireducens]
MADEVKATEAEIQEALSLLAKIWSNRATKKEVIQTTDRAVACPHCKEEIERLVVTGDIEVFYNIDSEEYTVGSVKDGRYLCNKCYREHPKANYLPER